MSTSSSATDNVVRVRKPWPRPVVNGQATHWEKLQWTKCKGSQHHPSLIIGNEKTHLIPPRRVVISSYSTYIMGDSPLNPYTQLTPPSPITHRLPPIPDYTVSAGITDMDCQMHIILNRFGWSRKHRWIYRHLRNDITSPESAAIIEMVRNSLCSSLHQTEDAGLAESSGLELLGWPNGCSGCPSRGPHIFAEDDEYVLRTADKMTALCWNCAEAMELLAVMG